MTPEHRKPGTGDIPPKAAGVTDIKLNRNRRSNAPGGMECFICGSIFIGDESHEFCRVCDEACNSGNVPTVAGLQERCAALEARTAAPSAPSGDAWAPSGKDYDRNIHHNPDAKAWADLFVETFPGLADKHGLMLGWFANAMMAMHDSMKSATPAPIVSGEPVAHGLEEAFTCGWTACAHWAEREDLITDIGSRAYQKEMDAVFTHPAPNAGTAAPTGDVGDANAMAWRGAIVQVMESEETADMTTIDCVNLIEKLALRAHPQPQAVVPYGWALVPLNPTPDMMEAYMHSFTSLERFDGAKVFRAMCLAAPPTDSAKGEK